MTDYRYASLTDRVDSIEAVNNSYNSEKEKQKIIALIKAGYSCAWCWMPYYNCLCNHDDDD